MNENISGAENEVVNIDELEGTPGVYVHTYNPPFEYNGKTYEKVVFDLRKLTGNDVRSINAELIARGIRPLSRRFDFDYQVRYAIKCAVPSMPLDTFLAQPARDVEMITTAVQNFLVL